MTIQRKPRANDFNRQRRQENGNSKAREKICKIGGCYSNDLKSIHKGRGMEKIDEA